MVLRDTVDESEVVMQRLVVLGEWVVWVCELCVCECVEGKLDRGRWREERLRGFEDRLGGLRLPRKGQGQSFSRHTSEKAFLFGLVQNR